MIRGRKDLSNRLVSPVTKTIIDGSNINGQFSSATNPISIGAGWAHARRRCHPGAKTTGSAVCSVNKLGIWCFE